MNPMPPNATSDPRVRGRILIADDNRDSRVVLSSCLEGAGYAVETAVDADEALVKGLRHPPDLFLLDVVMPRKDGFQLCREIRSNPVLQAIPIILITGLDTKVDRFKGIEAGCDEFLTKPVERGELLARVQTLIRLHTYRVQLDEKQAFERVLQHLSDGILVLDVNGRIATLNQAAATLLSLDFDRARGLDLLDWLYRIFQVSVPRPVLAGPEKPVSFEISRPETTNTSAVYLAANLDLIPLANGGVAGTVWTLRDVTRIKQETKLHRSFLSLVSHKLRTPISVISEHVSLLQDGLLGELQPDQRNSIDRVGDQAGRLKELVEKMLQFIQVEETGWDQTGVAFVLIGKLRESLQRVLRRYPDKKSEIRLTIPDGLYSLGLPAQSFQLIIESLVDNALKFCDKPVAEVTIGYRTAPEGVHELFVADNGPGIPGEECEKVFEEFYQIDKFFTGNVVGVGLGLALVRRLIGKAGGRTWMTSELGKGSTVHFTLPLIGSVLPAAA